MYDSFSSDKEDDIYISVKDARSPNEFIACLGTISDFSKFEFFLKKINDWCKANVIKAPLDKNDLYIEQPILVKYQVDKSDDCLWKRGKIIELQEESSEVLLIDEGIFLKVPFDDLNINMPDLHNELAGQAKMCSLSKAIPYSNEWTNEAIEYFKKIINDNGLAVTYVNKQPYKDTRNAFNQEYVIDVFYTNNKKQILDILVEENHAKILSFSAYRDSSMNQVQLNEEIIQLSSDEEENLETNEVDEILFVENVMEQSLSKNNISSVDLIDDDIIECVDDDSNEPTTSKNEKPKSKTNDRKLPFKKFYNKNKANNQNGYNGDESSLYTYLEEKANIPLLTAHDYICSDDTIQTGYKPNVNIDSNSIARQIKITNLKILQNTVYGEKDISNKFIPDEDESLKKTEKRIFEVISGTTGLYNNSDKKYNALAKIYIENPRSNLMIILTCILKEIKNNKIKIEDGFNLIQRLKFCTEAYFLQAFDQIVADNEPTEVDQEMVAIGDLKRQTFCYYLANLYKLAIKTERYSFLKSVPSKCNDLIKSWIDCQQSSVLCSVRHAKLKCIYDFLYICLDEFKHHHFSTFDCVLEKALEHTRDFTILPREIVTASNKLVEMFARAYRNIKVDKPSSGLANEERARNTDWPSLKNEPNNDFICFNRKKRKSTSPSFIDYFRNNNEDDEDL